jgi:hypothetical protein
MLNYRNLFTRQEVTFIDPMRSDRLYSPIDDHTYRADPSGTAFDPHCWICIAEVEPRHPPRARSTGCRDGIEGSRTDRMTVVDRTTRTD